jgi:C1A family cysteine protease
VNKWKAHHGIDLSAHPNGHANLRNAASTVKANRAQYQAGSETVLLGLTQFAHLCVADFASAYLGGNVPKQCEAQKTLVGRRPRPPPSYDYWNPWLPATTTLSPPAKNPGSNSGTINDNGTLNWADLGYVTPVKDQGVCGDCWAFASTGCMEGAYYKAKKNLTSFSEQQLVECVNTQSRGCNGGAETDAFAYAKTFGGMCTEQSYPYTSAKNAKYSKCSSTASTRVKVPFSVSYSPVSPSDANLLIALKKNVVDCGIGVSNSFQLYAGGVITSTKYCVSSKPQITANMLNHAVIMTGYNGPKQYWILKNSWGTGWGINGYFYLTSATSNMCGISSDANTCTVA